MAPHGPIRLTWSASLSKRCNSPAPRSPISAPFQPQRAVVLLIDDREDGYELADLVHNCPAMRVSSRRFERALDPAGEFDPEG